MIDTNLADWRETASPFHAGERKMQAQTGRREQIETSGRRMVRRYLPDQHRNFYAQLPFVIAGHVDDAGNPWATMLTGPPGFIASPDPKTLSLTVAPVPGDPLADALTQDRPLGLLGLAFHTRRRNRANGRIAAIEGGTVRLAVDQTFGNCPQYIQSRTVERVDAAPGTPETLTALDDAARALIAAADTFFVASAALDEDDPVSAGVDVSHRGGRPGFVRVDADGTLTVPDYLGNSHFNTLGNFVRYPRAGLLLLDFDTGEMLQLTGTVQIVHEGPEVDSFQGAERLWRFRMTRGVRLPGGMSLRWVFNGYAPNAALTGTWAEAEAAQTAAALRDAWRPHRIVRIVDESTAIRSFYLEPADTLGRAPHKAGQHLPIRLALPDEKRPSVRTYTLSSAPGDPLYRISVKRDGKVSKRLHDTWQVGDLVEAQAPRGHFHLDAAEPRPAVLLGAGVGITPMVAMLRHVILEGIRTRHLRRTTLIVQARTRAERALFDEVRALAQTTGGTVRAIAGLSRPDAADVQGEDYHYAGRLTADVLRAVLPLDDYDFYLCGPGGFMQNTYDVLRDLGVRDARIRAEAFGPASLTRPPDDGAGGPVDRPPVAKTAIVRFAASGVEMPWTPADGSLLALAERHGLTPTYGCRNGSCGTCRVDLTAGSVTYLSPPGTGVEAGSTLICCARPAADTVRVTLNL